MKDFKLHEKTDPLTGKVLRTYVHASGMRVKVLPRPGFSRRFAAVTVPFGSICTAFEASGQTWQIPAGSAHFLEHCVFSRDDGGGLLGRLSGMGASANAYTTYNHTMYYFSTVHHFAEALDIYLDAIFSPYLGEDRIGAEKPIILAEVDQYMDDPDTRCYERLMKNLFVRHPVREDVAGTADSVKSITGADLQAAWRHFYNPSALSLTLTGDFDEAPILESLAGRLERPGTPSQAPAHLILPEEPGFPASLEDRLTMDVSTPSFLIGFKDPNITPAQPLTGSRLVFRQRAGHLLMDTLLSPASPLYDALYAEGLINDSFGFHYACEENFAFVVCGGESNVPEKAASAVRDHLAAAFRQGIGAELFEIQKRAAAGDFISSLDSVENSGMIQAQCNLYDMDIFDYPGIYDKMDCTTAVGLLDFIGQPSRCSVATLHPEVKDSHDS